MKSKVVILLLLFTLILSKNLQSPNKKLNDYSDILRLINQTVSNNSNFTSASYNRLAYVVDTFGPRLWGSENLQAAIDYMNQTMHVEGFDNPRLELVPDIPHWVRGEEHLTLLSPHPTPTKVPMIGLGQSLGGNVTGEVIVVTSYEDLDNKKDLVNGKIVLFNYNWTSYGKGVSFRVSGASRAARYNATGCLIRSVTPVSIASPHTGSLYYDNKYPKIPAAAISVEDADMFSRMQKRGQKIVVNLYMEARFLNNTNSYNVVGELRGSTYPDEIVLLGGHIDSWDVGPQSGANDDGGGFMTCFEAVRVLIKLGLRPKRTIRFIAWSGEEFGVSASGGYAYMRTHQNEMDKHVVAFESDIGSTDIYGFAFNGGNKGFQIIKTIGQMYFGEYGADLVTYGNAENSDNEPLFDNYKIPQMRNLIRDTEDDRYYFTYHHSAGDSMSIMNPFEMDRNVALIAGMMYIIADLPGPIPRD
jgi:carboxypeptidase Q